MDLQDTNLLTPIIKIKTSAPAPELKVLREGDNIKSEIAPSTTKTVELRVCSEFLEHHAPIDSFYSLDKIVYQVDSAGQPLIFSVDTEKQLNVVAHVDGGPHAWQQIKITPGPQDSHVVAFGVTRSPNLIHIAAAIEGPNDTSRLFHATVGVPDLRWQNSSGRVEPDIKVALTWTETDYNEGPKKISSISCGRSKAPITRDSKFAISVGTEATGNLQASFFLVDPSPNHPAPWRISPLPVGADKILDVEPAVTDAGSGAFLLYEADGKTGVIQKVFKNDGSWLHDIRVLTHGQVELGNASDICGCTNISSQTDLYVASERGIGLFHAREPTAPPQVIMPTTSFKSVFGTETLDPSYPAVQQSHITLVAQSAAQELYFINGTRDITNNTVTFSESGLPIRGDVRSMSCVFNRQRKSHEVIYASNSSNVITHLALDPETECWNGHQVGLQGPETKPKPFPAYVTTITCVDPSGVSIGEGYALDLSGERVLLSVNKKALSLSDKPKTVRTDRHGKVTLVVATDAALSAPEVRVRLSQFDDKTLHNIYPAQRVMRKMSQISSPDHITNAVSTTGKEVFADRKHDANFQDAAKAAANVLVSLPDLVSHLSKDAANQILTGAKESIDEFVKIWEKDDNGIRSSEDQSWLDKVGNVLHKIGDTLEWLKNKVKGVVKGLVRFAIRLVGGVLDFVIEVGGKILRFVITKVGGLVRTLANFLKTYLGIDLPAFLDWLGLVFDVTEVKNTQKKLTEFASLMRTHVHTFNTKNESLVETGIERLRDKVKGFIDANTPKHESVSMDGVQIFSWLLDNPILEKIKDWNPFFWIMDAEKDGLAEGLADLLHTPDFSILWKAAEGFVTEAIETTLVSIANIVIDLWAKIKAVFDNPDKACGAALDWLKDTFLTLFDELKTLIGGLMEVVTAAVEQTFEVLMGVWKIPLVTTLFEIYADQEFSLMNVLTFSIAQIMQIFFQATTKKKPFEVLGDPSALFEGWSETTLDVGAVLKVEKTIPSKPTSTTPLLFAANPTANNPSTDGSDTIHKAHLDSLPLDITFPPGRPRDDKDLAYLEAKYFITRYEGYLSAIGVLGTIMSSAIGVATYTSTSKNELPPKPEPHQTAKIKAREVAKENQLSQATIAMNMIGSSVAFIGRASQLALFCAAVNRNEDLRNEWASDPSLLCGYIFPVCTNGIAIFINAANCLKFGQPWITVSSNVIMQMGDIAQQVCFKYTHHPPNSDAAFLDPYVKQKAPGGLRIFSAGTGMGFNVAGLYKDTQPGAVACGIFGGLSMISLTLALGIENHKTLKIDERLMEKMHLLD